MANPSIQNVDEGIRASSSEVPLSKVDGKEPEKYTSFEAKYNRENISIKWLLIDLACIVAVGIPILVFYFGVEPYHRGFYCNDQSINKPYKGSTVKNFVATIVGLFLNGFAFIVVEILNYNKDKSTRNTKEQVFFIGPIKLNLLHLRISKIVAVFLFGAAVNTLLTDIGKYTIGRLRPHFLSVCKPNATLFNCTSEFITEAVCTGDPVFIRKGRLSFPSGHASYSAYTMVFLVLYLQARVKIPHSVLLKPLVQLIPLMLAILCGLSRISDYKHHPSDVLAGLLLGTIIAVIVVCFSLQWFEDIGEIPNKKSKKFVKEV